MGRLCSFVAFKVNPKDDWSPEAICPRGPSEPLEHFRVVLMLLRGCGAVEGRDGSGSEESARQEGAQDISTGRVKKLQGWRSDQTGLRRPRGRPWGKLTGTPVCLTSASIWR